MKVYEFIVEKNITINGAPIFLCHETTMGAVMEANEKETATVEVGWPVSGIVKGKGEIKVSVLPGGKMVHTVHHGHTSPAGQHISCSLPGWTHRDFRYPVRSVKCIPMIPAKLNLRRLSLRFCSHPVKHQQTIPSCYF